LGETRIKVMISGEKGTKVVDAVVDTGATNTVVDAELARELGIRVTRTDEVILANGSTEKVGVGSADVEILGVRTMVPVYIYRQTLVGLTTLEAAGFRVNPVTRQLGRVPGKLLSIRARLA